MSELFFLHPERWPILLAPIAILALGLSVEGRRLSARRAFADVEAHPLLLADAAPVRRRLRLAFEFVGLLLLAAATLEPAVGWTVQDVERRGIDIAVCLDTSRSMNAEDIAPSRSARARRDILALLPELRGDRIALVAFAGDAREVCPLTHDRAAFESLLAEVDDRTTRRGGTNLGAAIRTALALLPADEAASQAILVLTDGEDLAGKAKGETERAMRRGVAVHSIGYGSPQGAKIPDLERRGEFLRDERGAEVVSKMDAQGLRELAAACGGAFLPADAVARPLVEVFRKRIRPMQQRRFETSRRRRPRQRFQWLVLPGFLFLLLAFVDRGRRSRDNARVVR